MVYTILILMERMKLKKKPPARIIVLLEKEKLEYFFPDVTCIIGIGIGVLKLGWYSKKM